MLTFGYPKTTTRLSIAIRIVRQSEMVSRPKLIQTVRMIATEAILTPSRKAEKKRDFRILGTSGFSKAINTKEGRKTAIVANMAPCAPFNCQPIKVTDENKGPGVNCPTAIASTSCTRDNIPFATSSLSKKANKTYPLPYRMAPIFKKIQNIFMFVSEKKG